MIICVKFKDWGKITPFFIKVWEKESLVRIKRQRHVACVDADSRTDIYSLP